VSVKRYVGVRPLMAGSAALAVALLAAFLLLAHGRPAAETRGTASGGAGDARAGLRWVALGDSFSAGEGLHPFIAGTDVPNDRCHRSQRAYPSLDRARLAAARLWFFACGGATTRDIADVTQRPPESVPQALHPQLAEANLVTLTIGLNDIGFAGALMYCARNRACNAIPSFTRRMSSALATLPAELASAYDAIRAHVQPSATVVVLGYPQLFPERPAAQRCPELYGTFDAGEQDYFNREFEVLNGVIARAAAAAGFYYASALSAFRGHAPCEPDSYLNGITDPGEFGVSFGEGSFHPNAAGQRAYARLLRSFLRTR
jgi:lysophospholipase L1-like esterase